MTPGHTPEIQPTCRGPVLLLLTLPIVFVVGHVLLFLQAYAPSNILIARVRAAPPRWGSVLLLILLAYALIWAAHRVSLAIDSGAPEWPILVVFVLAWDSVKAGLLAGHTALRLGAAPSRRSCPGRATGCASACSAGRPLSRTCVRDNSSMLPGDSAGLRKARGAFFTPERVARFITDWAIRTAHDSILEPSCGEAVFLHQIDPGHAGPVVGIEIHQASALQAERTLRRDGIDAVVHNTDFFGSLEYGRYDAAVGNPPYVRYQGWTGDARAASLQAALRAGVNLTNLASSWAAFTVHSALHLRAGGRLGLVLPAELLTVNYASPVRQFLMNHFADVTLVLFEERVFPRVEVEAVLLLADDYDPDGRNGTDHMSLVQVRDANELTDLAAARRWTPPSRGARWSAGLMTSRGLTAYSAATAQDDFTVLEKWGDTTLGMVTGNNKFFTLSPAKVQSLGLAASDTVRLSPPGSRHLRALTLTKDGLARLGEEGQATYLFRPGGEPSAAAWRYIRSGEDLDVHTAYKCRVRKPWWRTPYLRPADLFLTYMNADTPRLATNRAKAHHLNSIHGVYLNRGVRDLGRSLLPIASLNSVTLLGAEVVGRAYGGGMLKIEPREADHLPMPSPGLVEAHQGSLTALRPKVSAALRSGRLLDAVSLVDEVLLGDGLAMSPHDQQVIRSERARLAARRATRGKDGARGEG